MPELPEVETIKNDLLRKIRGKKIKDVKILDPKVVNFKTAEFKKNIIGASIKDIRRRAKLLIINLSTGQILLIHLKLTGQLIYNGSDEKYARAIFYFANKNKLVFKDFRRFGYLKIIPIKNLDKYFEKEKFGPEPLSKEFNLELFEKLLKKRAKAKIKPLLLDQKFIAGIGNIYADESLFYARISPLRTAGSLKKEEVTKLYNGIRKILKLATQKRGSSVDNYLDTSGKKGNYVPLLKVYGREGEKCFRCKGKVKRIKIGGRSASFCPVCQK